jgi:plastocyanin
MVTRFTRMARTAAAATLLLTGRLDAQDTLERSPNLTGGWIGYPGVLQVHLPYRFAGSGGGSVIGTPTFDLGMSLSPSWLAGARYAVQSPTVRGEPDEWEALVRYRLLAEGRGSPLDLAFTAAYNGAARSADGEISLTRWVGPVRALTALRAMTAAAGDDARFALAAGAAAHLREGVWPIALAGDVGSTIGAGDAAWGVALQVGVGFTTHTLSLFATNTPSSTIQGASRGSARTRFGFDFTLPIAVGRFFGWYVPREDAADAVQSPPPGGAAIRADIHRYLFAPKVIEIAAGSSIEWVNADEVVHTVASDDGAWNSGAIQPGAAWSARFDRPGRYLFHCGPHPYMKGVVIVRGPL